MEPVVALDMSSPKLIRARSGRENMFSDWWSLLATCSRWVSFDVRLNPIKLGELEQGVLKVLKVLKSCESPDSG